MSQTTKKQRKPRPGDYTQADLDRQVKKCNKLEERLEDELALLRVIRYEVTGVMV